MQAELHFIAWFSQGSLLILIILRCDFSTLHRFAPLEWQLSNTGYDMLGCFFLIFFPKGKGIDAHTAHYVTQSCYFLIMLHNYIYVIMLLNYLTQPH